VERGGNVTNLDCINYFITVKKNINIFKVPIAGMRYALDPNRVDAEIRLVCILRDDDCSSADLDDSKAVGSIDFSSTSAGGEYLIGVAGQEIADIAEFHGTQVLLQSTDIQTITATFDTTTSSNATSGNTVTVGLQGLSNPVHGSDVATRLKLALEANSNFSARYTVSASNGRKAAILASNKRATKLTFTQKVAGVAGNNFTPSFVSPMNNSGSTNNAAIAHPAIITFTGGATNKCKSAGDKAQDILASVVNSNFTGITGEGVTGSKFESWSFGNESTIGDLGLAVPLHDFNHEDYIVGLQIPYNSLRHATLGVTGDPIQGYEPRNFLMVTGHVDSGGQGSEANDESASVKFDPIDKYTGISGTLQDCELKYDAGATVYEVTLTFMPLDVIYGI
tara:strand:- start:615 stop:1796 length:1182 start_codon:yes stop_codon:yes gene_type:complete